MAKRPVSKSKKPKRQLHRVDPRRTLAIDEFNQLKTWALRQLADHRAYVDHTWARNTTVGAGAHVDTLTLRNAAIVLVMLGTGARRFELCAFRCGDFTEVQTNTGPEYRARFDEAKGNVEAEIPISPETWQVLDHWFAVKKFMGEPRAPDDPLFCGRGNEHLSRAQLNNIWNATIQRAGLTKRKDVSCHASRHAAGMMLLRATGSLPLVSKFLRHASIKVTERFYQHVLGSDIAAGLGKAGL